MIERERERERRRDIEEIGKRKKDGKLGRIGRTTKKGDGRKEMVIRRAAPLSSGR